MRRVVVGKNTLGRSVIVNNETPAAIPLESMPGVLKVSIWGGDDRPLVPNDGRPPVRKTYNPPPGGYRVGVEHIPPDSVTGNDHLDIEALKAEMDEKFPGWTDDVYTDPEAPGMHATRTVDFVTVLEGELQLEVDDGEVVTLEKGDWVVQNGTPHRWRNRSGHEVVIAFFQVGANTA